MYLSLQTDKTFVPDSISFYGIVKVHIKKNLQELEIFYFKRNKDYLYRKNNLRI
jgi:hypothetical protein